MCQLAGAGKSCFQTQSAVLFMSLSPSSLFLTAVLNAGLIVVVHISHNVNNTTLPSSGRVEHGTYNLGQQVTKRHHRSLVCDICMSKLHEIDHYMAFSPTAPLTGRVSTTLSGVSTLCNSLCFAVPCGCTMGVSGRMFHT